MSQFKERIKNIDWKNVYQQECSNIILKANKNQPCPACGGKDRFHLRETFKVDGYYYCRNCGNGDGIDLIQKINNCNFNQAMIICGEEPKTSNDENINTIQQYISALPKASEQFEYLTNKGIKPTCSIKQDKNKLIIPKQNHSGKLIGYESIDNNGIKRYNGSKETSWHEISNQNVSCNPYYVFVEGYATG